MTYRTPSEHNKTRSELNAVTELNSGLKVNSGSELNPQSKNNTEKLPAVVWTRKLCEVKDVIRVPVDNYQLATLATIKHRSDNDEIEWTEDPFECKSQPPKARR